MSSDESTDKECPLCMEPFDFDDVNFYPCTCQYQICRFCWHRLRTDENGLCPACRQPYPENPVNYQPISGSELQKFKSKSKIQRQTDRIKQADSRKHLGNYRVLQKNLVYVVGLSQKLADPDHLKRYDYCGRYGKILKVAVGATSILNNAGQQTSCTAYVTYTKEDEALRAIEGINNAIWDGRQLKASLGTTKYCSTFLRGQTCHKQECMYLHTIADAEVSFTKDDMHAGKHTDFERKLHEQLAARTAMAQKKRTLAGEKSESVAKKLENGLTAEALRGTDSATTTNEANRSTTTPSSQPQTQSSRETPESTRSASSSPAQSSPAPPLSSRPDSEDTNPTALSNSETLNSTQQSIKNKFTTCDEFERMLILENQAPSTTTCNGDYSHKDTNFDDDLGFDPFSESSKALADLVIEEQECRSSANQADSQKNTQSASSLYGKNSSVLNDLFNSVAHFKNDPISYRGFEQHPFINNPLLDPLNEQQQQNKQNRLFQTPPAQPPNFTTATQQPRPLDSSDLYNSYMHQNTYMHYKRLRDYANAAVQASDNNLPYPPSDKNMPFPLNSTMFGAPADSMSQPPKGPPNSDAYREEFKAIFPNVNVRFVSSTEEAHNHNNKPATPLSMHEPSSYVGQNNHRPSSSSSSNNPKNSANNLNSLFNIYAGGQDNNFDSPFSHYMNSQARNGGGGSSNFGPAPTANSAPHQQSHFLSNFVRPLDTPLHHPNNHFGNGDLTVGSPFLPPPPGFAPKPLYDTK